MKVPSVMGRRTTIATAAPGTEGGAVDVLQDTIRPPPAGIAYDGSPGPELVFIWTLWGAQAWWEPAVATVPIVPSDADAAGVASAAVIVRPVATSRVRRATLPRSFIRGDATGRRASCLWT
jgi:hypothetical protein